MSDRWAALLPIANAALLGPLRLVRGVEVCEQPASVWLRGNDLESIDSQLRELPDVRRFRCLEDGQLIASDRLVPSGMLPGGEWIPIAQWLGCRLPRAAWPGQMPPAVRLHLLRTSKSAEPSLLLLPLLQWQAYVAKAPQVRLDRLSFALDRTGRVLVRGTPLPPLEGQRFVELEGIIVPVGWRWQPAVAPATLRVLLGLDSGGEDPIERQGDLALLTSADGQWERISAQAFVRASRSAVRVSAEAADERS